MEIGSHSGSSSQQGHLSTSESKSKKRGGWRAITYILGNESFEKLAAMSLISNITVYLSTRYNLSGVLLVNVVTIWGGTSNVASIAGAIISDAYLGRFYTLLFGVCFSLTGMAAMTLTAGIPELRPPACSKGSVCIQPDKWQLAFLFSGLGLIAIGAGGIRPCNIAFGADQFDTRTAKGRAHLESFFNWWYFSFTIALIIALTGVVYVQTNISWVIGFAIPTACLVVSIIVFLIGRHTYVYAKPQGTIFIDLAKVISAAFWKRKISLKSNAQLSFYNPASDEESMSEMPKVTHVRRFTYLDKAAVIVDPAELDAQNLPTNSWKLCSVQQVGNLKSLVGIIPVWFSGIGCLVVMDQQNTFGVLQAMQMDRSIGKHFTIPPGWMGITSMIALSIWIFIYECVYIPNARKLLKRESRLTMKQRIGIGIVMSILCMTAAGLVERKRHDSALKAGSFSSPLHVAALLPQFMLAGLTEAFAAVAVMEFFTLQLPESMRSVAGAVFFLSLSIASYLSTLIVNVVHAVTRGKGRSAWLGGNDLNKNRLQYYYFIIAGLGAINLIYFTLFASNYVVCRKPVKVAEEMESENAIDLKERSASSI